MSHEIRELVWEYSKAPVAPRAVLLVIADHANSDGRAWPGVREIKRRTGIVSYSTICDAIKWLEEHGELFVQRREGRGKVNLYRINLTIFQEREAKSATVTVALQPLKRYTDRSATVSGGGATATVAEALQPVERIRQDPNAPAPAREAQASSRLSSSNGTGACAPSVAATKPRWSLPPQGFWPGPLPRMEGVRDAERWMSWHTWAWRWSATKPEADRAEYRADLARRAAEGTAWYPPLPDWRPPEDDHEGADDAAA